MNFSKQKIKQTSLATAMAAILGAASIPGQASAGYLTLTISGWLTLIDSTGEVAVFNTDTGGAPMYGGRTAVSGTMTFDTQTNSGTIGMDNFSFFGAGVMEATSIFFQDIDGPSGASTLMLGNMSFNWNGNNGIPVSIIWDAQGLFAAIDGGLSAGSTIGTGCTGCVDGWSEDFDFDFGSAGTNTLPMGSVPIATVDWNTTDIGTVIMGTNPSGTLPLIADAIGGSPMKAGPFLGWNANFDIAHITVIQGTEFVDIIIPGGDTKECATTSGSELSMNAQITIPDNDAVDTITWSLDGVPIASDESIVVLVPLGVHAVEVSVTTVLGMTFSDTASVTIEDTTKPVINTAFINPKTGAEVTTINKNIDADISFSVSDSCDASPSSSATAGLPVLDGNSISARTSKKEPSVELSIKGNADNIELTVTAEDASGNMAVEKSTLTITP